MQPCLSCGPASRPLAEKPSEAAGERTRPPPASRLISAGEIRAGWRSRAGPRGDPGANCISIRPGRRLCRVARNGGGGLRDRGTRQLAPRVSDCPPRPFAAQNAAAAAAAARGVRLQPTAIHSISPAAAAAAAAAYLQRRAPHHSTDCVVYEINSASAVPMARSAQQ
ncbi:homeobox protein unc-4 homolog [Schistocerca gregaria]|uniref:homeobox protein unc-4 homolog n=1 Tax=Schistocerca gregaria TaxID=7010 RepID=UPI00211E43EE|nr:homeobox protein unc-4 homolog [Schistocerca gregaria]